MDGRLTPYSSGEGTRVTFRPVASDDGHFLLQVYASTRMEELALVGWTDAQRDAFLNLQLAAQKDHYRNYYPDAAHEIILIDGQPAGQVWVARLNDEIRILDITLLPQHRGRGVGTPIIEQLMREAGEVGKPLHIYVDQFSPSLRLFERLGFSKVDEYGYSFKMRWAAGG